MKNATLILLIAVHFVVTHEDGEKMTAFISVKTLFENLFCVSSSHSDQVIKIIVKFISASATTIIISFYALNEKMFFFWWKEKWKLTHLNSSEESSRIVAVAVRSSKQKDVCICILRPPNANINSTLRVIFHFIRCRRHSLRRIL